MGRVVSCRTLPRFTEVVCAGLVAVVLGVGVALILLGAVSGLAAISMVGLVVGLGFLAIGCHQCRLLLMRTASQLALDTAKGRLTWRATAAHGELSIQDVVSITRTTRPNVYQFHCGHQSNVSFWLVRKGAAVRFFFEQLREANPSISLTDLYENHRMWWRGLPRA